MRFSKEFLQVYAVTPPDLWAYGDPLGTLAELCASGITMLQLREKDCGYNEYCFRGRTVREITARYGIPLIINDNPHVALAVGADGVHMGQKDGDLVSARKLLGEDRILGTSLRTLDQAAAVENCPVDYLGVGAVFPTATKGDAQYIGIGRLKEICGKVPFPVVAIGGITPDNASQLAGSGAAGAALVSGLFHAEDKVAAIQQMKEIVRHFPSDKT